MDERWEWLRRCRRQGTGTHGQGAAPRWVTRKVVLQKAHNRPMPARHTQGDGGSYGGLAHKTTAPAATTREDPASQIASLQDGDTDDVRQLECRNLEDCCVHVRRGRATSETCTGKRSRCLTSCTARRNSRSMLPRGSRLAAPDHEALSSVASKRVGASGGNQSVTRRTWRRSRGHASGARTTGRCNRRAGRGKCPTERTQASCHGSQSTDRRVLPQRFAREPRTGIEVDSIHPSVWSRI